MKLQQLFRIILIAGTAAHALVFQVNAQTTDSVTNNNNENVDITVQEEGSQQQGQSANGNTSDVTVTDEDAEDNFWTNGSRTQLVVPEGNASLTCGEQMISFSRSGGFNFGVGAASINSSDNQGQLPEDFRPSLAAIQQCARAKNISEILEQYVKLAKVDTAIAQTFLRTVSPEIYATFFVENAKDKGGILSEQSFNNLANNLRQAEFDQVIQWQDDYQGAALAQDRVEFKKNLELQAIERDKRLSELEVLELQRKAREVKAILDFQQSQLNQSLQKYQQPD